VPSDAITITESHRTGGGSSIGKSTQSSVAGSIVDALKRLEYRGYDFRRRGDARERPAGAIGVGHTRWVTHGKPTETNAHPHASPRLAVVHNGIIEDFRALRQELAAKGYAFATETDSEIAAFGVEGELAKGKSPQEAVHAALPCLRGAFALVYLFEREENLLIGARQGAPLAIGNGDREMYLGS
jgi:glucosamine--fructose-6-phosphate aminotransferase (isomerizing)